MEVSINIFFKAVEMCQYPFKFVLYRLKNKHNQTYIKIQTISSLPRVFVGFYSYGPIQVLSYGNKSAELHIGSFCSIASDVKFMLAGNHNVGRLSTYPYNTRILHTEKYETETKGNIVVESDVWIGREALILSGVHIGRGAVIAARAVVSRDVPPYSIFIDRKTIIPRFSKNITEKLMSIDPFKYIDNKIKVEEMIGVLYKEVTDENIDNLLSKFLCFRQ
jgi:acetyltransferase-like isoleucine patch superfamily enzyme